MAYFEASGVSQKTGRPIKPKTIEAMDEARARAAAESDGMTVNEIKRLPDDEPTDKQIAFAKELGVSIPKGANRKEVSDLISNAVDWDEPADAALMAYADKLNIVYTKYTGVKKLYANIWYVLPPDIKIRATWFTYCLYRDLLPKRTTPVATSYEHPAIQAIAEKAIQDPAVVESINRYEGANLAFFGQRTTKSGELQEGGSLRTKAYKAISELLRADEQLGLAAAQVQKASATRSKPAAKSTAKAAAKAASKSGGCLLTIVSLVTGASALIVICVWFVASMIGHTP